MRIALIHDHLAQEGGAEKVLEVLSEMYPEAPIYTLIYDQEKTDRNFPGKKIEASVIQRLPGGLRFYRWYMPLMPMAVEFFDLRNYDVVISDTSSFAKGVITHPNTLHICYCHTPTRFVWSDTHQYINELKYNKYFKKLIAIVLNYIRIWDRQAADRVDTFIANSATVKKRIKKYYKRDSHIIYPSIEEEKYYVSDKQGDFFLSGSRLVPYKRHDIVIQACKELGLKLKVFGSGIDMDRLKEVAGDDSNIEILGRISDKEKAKLFSTCRAYINPQREDFGLTIVEAMASGRPVIAVGQGGAKETIIAGQTGEFFPAETKDALKAVLQNFDHTKYNGDEIREQALKFSKANFKRQISEFVDREYKKFKEE